MSFIFERPPVAGGLSALRTFVANLLDYLEAAFIGLVSPQLAAYSDSGSQTITTTEATLAFDTEEHNPDENANNVAGEITVREGGYYDVAVNVPLAADHSALVWCFLQRDQASAAWIAAVTVRGQGTAGLSASGIVRLEPGEAVRVRVDTASGSIATASGQATINLNRVRSL